MPRCGFSARVSQILAASGVDYAAMDILPDPRIREQLSSLSGWPTIPQLFVGGELVGGCDIVTEMFESGELAEALGAEQPQTSVAQPAPAPQAPPLQIE
jgi:monothiol glutaredoxin